MRYESVPESERLGVLQESKESLCLMLSLSLPSVGLAGFFFGKQAGIWQAALVMCGLLLFQVK